MARAHFVKRAQKDYPAHGIKKGESYYWWKFMVGGRGGPKHYSKTPPKASQLTQSDFLGQFYDLEEDIGKLAADDGLESAVADIAQRFRDLGEDQQSKFDNMPDGLQSSQTGAMLEQRAERCSEIADELENIDFSVEADEPDEDDGDPVDPWQDRLDEVQQVDLSVE